MKKIVKWCAALILAAHVTLFGFIDTFASPEIDWKLNEMTASEFIALKGNDMNYAIADVETSLRVRARAGMQYTVIGQLLTNGLCYVEAIEGEWAYISSGNIEGYVHLSYLITNLNGAYLIEKMGEDRVKLALEPEYRVQETEDVSAPVSSLRQQVVDYALQFVGNPYVWGGTSLTEGADCSGFVQAVYHEFGITIPRVSKDQSVCATQITVEEAQPGDLIFYSKDGEIYHVVMYIGDGQVVHASSPETGIKVSNVSKTQAVWAIDMESCGG